MIKNKKMCNNSSNVLFEKYYGYLFYQTSITINIYMFVQDVMYILIHK